jgi:hypothetical protein
MIAEDRPAAHPCHRGRPETAFREITDGPGARGSRALAQIVRFTRRNVGRKPRRDQKREAARFAPRQSTLIAE